MTNLSEKKAIDDELFKVNMLQLKRSKRKIEGD